MEKTEQDLPPALDFAGTEVPRNCENCDGLFDDGDGYEYGPPQPACRIKPQMGYLKHFPFKTPQKCFQIAWWHLVDWDAEGRKLDEQATESKGCSSPMCEAPNDGPCYHCEKAMGA